MSADALLTSFLFLSLDFPFIYNIMCHFLNLYVSYAHTLLSPRVQQMLADIAGDEIYGQLRVDFCGFDR